MFNLNVNGVFVSLNNIIKTKPIENSIPANDKNKKEHTKKNNKSVFIPRQSVKVYNVIHKSSDENKIITKLDGLNNNKKIINQKTKIKKFIQCCIIILIILQSQH